MIVTLNLRLLIARTALETVEFLVKFLLVVLIVVVRHGLRFVKKCLNVVYVEARESWKTMKEWKTYDMPVFSEHFDFIDEAVNLRLDDMKLYDPHRAALIRSSWVRMKADFLRSAVEEQINERTA